MPLVILIIVLILCDCTSVSAISWHWVASKSGIEYSFDSDELVVDTDIHGRRFAEVWIRQSYPSGKQVGDQLVFERITRECLYLEERTMSIVENYLLDDSGKIIRRVSVPLYQRTKSRVEKTDTSYEIWKAMNTYWVNKKYRR